MASSPSARSTSSLRITPKNPAWRCYSVSKNSAQASLSFVLAEPEQGAPLASATNQSQKILRDVQSVRTVGLVLGSRSGRAVSDPPASGRITDTSPLPARRPPRATRPSTMSSKERKAPRREPSSASNVWLEAVTKSNGKEREIAQPIVTLTIPSLTDSINAHALSPDVLLPIASSSKSRAEDQVPASISSPIVHPIDIPPEHLPSLSASESPSTGNALQITMGDVTLRPTTASPSEHDVLSGPDIAHIAHGITSASNVDCPAKSTEISPRETDPTSYLPEGALPADPGSSTSRPWFGTWFAWSSSAPRPHGGNSTSGDPDNHQIDHLNSRHGNSNETQDINLNSSLETPRAASEYKEVCPALPPTNAHGDKHQPYARDDNQVPPGDLADVSNGDTLTSSCTATNQDAANPTEDNAGTDAVAKSANPDDSQTTVRDAVHAVPQASPSDSWWDYIGWKNINKPAASSGPDHNRNGNADRNTLPDLRVGDTNTADAAHIEAQGKVATASPCQSTESKSPLSGDVMNHIHNGVYSVGANGHGDGAMAASRERPISLPAVRVAEGPGMESGSKLKSELVSTNADVDSGMHVRGRAGSLSSSAPSSTPSMGPTQDQVNDTLGQGHDRVHAGGGGGVGGGAWYSPWTWYGHSYGSDAGTGSVADGGGVQTEKMVQDEKGEAERPESGITTQAGVPASVTNESENRVRAEGTTDAGADEEKERERELQVVASCVSASASASTSIAGTAETVEINPIAATIDTHRSSWLSFFSSRTSRTLVVKSITDGPSTENVTDPAKVDENGMEVMDIEDEGAPQVSQPPSTQKEDTSKTKEMKANAIPAILPSQGLVATLMRGKAKVRGQPRTEQDKDGGSDTSSVRSLVHSSMETNGIATPPRPEAQDSLATADSSSSSPSNTTSVVKKASIKLATSTTKANVNTASSANAKIVSPKPTSPTPSSTPKKLVTPPPPPNLILPTWQDTFHTAPRNVVPRAEVGTIAKTMQYVSGILFSGGRMGRSLVSGGSQGRGDKGKQREKSVDRERREREFEHFGKALPRAWDVLDAAAQPAVAAVTLDKDALRGCKRVVVIGVHGWFPGAVMRTVIGEPTGTSSKLANMMVQALEEFQAEHGVKLEKITKIPLEGEGMIKLRVDKLYANLVANQEWINDIHSADAILISTHSQGSVVSTHLLDRLISDKHIRTQRNSVVVGPATSVPAVVGMDTAPAPRPQKICCLSMCGIHLGPLRYLSTTSLFQPYFQYLEKPAARELFEFQNTDSDASKDYVRSLGNVLSNGVKMVYVASLNDQVVPLYSGVFTAASHPLILRALYIDGDAHHSSDFLANLLVLLLRIFNSGMSDSGLLVHLSEATAGSLNGVGHSTAYEEIATYALAVKYLFTTNDGLEDHPELVLEPFNARQEQNDYEIPWALRDVIADDRVAYFFSDEIVQLRDAFRGWQPRTSILRELKRKLQPIQRLPASFSKSRL
ncbi:hypothetical protein APHAL10511_004076 [Amanita phalloides]|nr:hypothetical protein APHAL10511_004076 [Amanita phalloides]